MLNNSLSPHQKIRAPWLITVAIWLLTEPLLNALVGWIDEELGISNLLVQRALIYVWHYGIPVALIAFGVWFLIQPRLSGWPKSGAAKDESNVSLAIDTTLFPDWTIRELFFYLRPDVVDDKDLELWKVVGSQVQDQLSIGRLKIWGREIQKPSRTRAPLREIEKSYWSHALFSFWFLGENQVDKNHTYSPQGAGLTEYCDLGVNKAQALNIWPVPLADEFMSLTEAATVVDEKIRQTGSIETCIDAKSAAIQFFKKVLNIGTPSERDWSGNLGSEADLDILAEISPVGKNWVQYVIALGCYRINIEAVGDKGGKIKLLKYIGKMNHASEVNGVAYALGKDDGEQFDDGSRYDDFLDNKSLYESGVLKLNAIQRREAISHFVKSPSEGKWSWPSRK